MPAKNRTASKNSSVTEPYSLRGASKFQLTAFTVAALQLHFKYFKLPTQGKKATLVKRLHSHLLSIEANVTTNPPLLTPRQEIPTTTRSTDSYTPTTLKNTQGATSSNTSAEGGPSATGTMDDDCLSVAPEPGQTTSFTIQPQLK